MLDNRIRYFITAYGSKEALEEIAGRIVYQLKEDFRQGQKEEELAQRMQNKITQTVRVNPQQVKAYYDKIFRDSLAFYESELEVGEIVIYPKASRELEKLSVDDLTEYKKQAETGKAKFESLASLYSDDPRSKNNGGQYAITIKNKLRIRSLRAQ